MRVACALNRRAGPVPEEAAEFFDAKGLQPGFSHLDVWGEEHLRAFTAAKVMREDVLGAMHAETGRALREGRTFEQWRGTLRERLIEMGWWGEQEVVDPETGRAARVDVPSRMHRMFDTNMRAARAAGQWQRIVRRKDTHPYLMYLLGPSKEHRVEHIAWHGIVLPVDDPWWQEHFPPNGFGCKCHCRQLSRREAARLGKEGVAAPDRKPILGPDGLPTGHVEDRRVPVKTERPRVIYVDFKNKRTGETARIPKGVQPGFHRPPSSLTQWQSEKPTPEPTREELAELESEVFESEARPSRPMLTKEVGELLGRAMDAHPHDGGLRLRRLGRAIVREQLGRDAELRQGTLGKPESGVVRFVKMRPGVLGLHHMETGVVQMTPGMRQGLNRAAAALRAERRLPKTGERALHTLVHETIHGFGFDDVNAFVRHVGGSKAGRFIEEAVTETLARKVLRDKFDADLPAPVTGSQPRDLPYERLLLQAHHTVYLVAENLDVGLRDPDQAVFNARVQSALEDAAGRMRQAEQIVAEEPPDVPGVDVAHNGFVWSYVDALPFRGNATEVRTAKLFIYGALSGPEK